MGDNPDKDHPHVQRLKSEISRIKEKKGIAIRAKNNAYNVVVGFIVTTADDEEIEVVFGDDP